MTSNNNNKSDNETIVIDDEEDGCEVISVCAESHQSKAQASGSLSKRKSEISSTSTRPKKARQLHPQLKAKPTNATATATKCEEPIVIMDDSEPVDSTIKRDEVSDANNNNNNNNSVTSTTSPTKKAAPASTPTKIKRTPQKKIFLRRKDDPLSPNETQEERLLRLIKMREDEIEKLKRKQEESKPRNFSKSAAELDALIAKWREAVRNILLELQSTTKPRSRYSPPDMDKVMGIGEMLQAFQIDPNLVGYDAENDCFTDD